MTKDKIHFPGLNGLRFIAAGIVIVHHLEQAKYTLGFPSLWKTSRVIDNLGALGVSLFFVLSGFLITYLLLAEQEKTQTISIRNFYMRRILRIWPLYYLVFATALFIFPPLMKIEHPEKGLLLFLLILPNIARALHEQLMGFWQAWSVGVEEQFYLLWPWGVKFFKRRLISLLLSIIAIKTLLLHFSYHWTGPLASFVEQFQIEKMAVGGIGACLLFRRSPLLRWVYSKTVQVVVLSGCCLLLFNSHFPLLYNLVEASLFCMLILNVASNGGTLLKLENPILNYLGKISYGLYMWHYMVVLLVVSFFEGQWICYPLSFLFTIALASLSYHAYEMTFLKLKSRFGQLLSEKSDDAIPEKIGGAVAEPAEAAG